jgi:hypothetical protein
MRFLFVVVRYFEHLLRNFMESVAHGLVFLVVVVVGGFVSQGEGVVFLLIVEGVKLGVEVGGEEGLMVPEEHASELKHIGELDVVHTFLLDPHISAGLLRTHRCDPLPWAAVLALLGTGPR